MIGLSILKQAYHLLESADKAANADGDEMGLMAVNQIYSELWHREHKEPFRPLSVLRQRVELSWRFLPALAYGTAMLLCLNNEKSGSYIRLQTLYERAASHTGGLAEPRQQTLFRVGEDV